MSLELTDANFDAEVMQYEGVVLVDFWAPWCGPCQTLMPIIEELEKEFEGKVKIAKLNVDDAPEIAQKYSVMSIPTIVILKNGEVEEAIMGAQPKEVFATKLTELTT
ncbi:thioredoxin [Patescibacteria group bacterium]